jgi:hypothetical protein
VAVSGIDDDAGFFPGLDETGAGLGVGQLEDEGGGVFGGDAAGLAMCGTPNSVPAASVGF